MPKEVKILKGQNLSDIAIQETGYFEGIYCIAIANSISMTTDIAAGSLITIGDNCANQDKLRLVTREGLKPATDYSYYIQEGSGEPTLGGIGYMAVEIDFIVK